MSAADLEAALTRIPGVQTARVVGEPQPNEIHLVATPGRTPKQLVRDVQSLLSASFGLEIDHRIVSVVQLTALPATDADSRPIINHVVVASTGSGSRVDVEFRWPNGKTTGGGASAGLSRDERVRATADAAIEALLPTLSTARVSLSLAGVTTQGSGPTSIVVVRLTWSEKGGSVPLVGASLVGDDVVLATTRAVLDAVNRKLALAFGAAIDEPR